MLDFFVEVPNEYYPIYSWIWNGKIERSEIRQQMREMYDANIKNIYIIPESKNFRSEYMPTYMEPDYLTKEYLELYAYAVEQAAQRGMRVWIYDEDGWPSGSAGGRTARGREDIRIHHLVKDGQGYRTEDCSGGKFYPNLMQKEATKAFLAETHKKYQKKLGVFLGSTITAAFTDEPHIDTEAYDQAGAQQFHDKYGYSIEPYLTGEKTRTRQVNIDWMEYCTDRFAENYFGTLQSWCRQNGLLFTGHVNLDDSARFIHSCGNILKMLRKLDIPGVDVILRQVFPKAQEEILYTLDGDSFDRVKTCENRFYPRFASSAAHHLNARRALAECFAVYGAMRYTQMRYVIHFLLVRRINLINIMSISYGKRGHVCGGMRPNFIAEAPDHFGLREFNTFVAAECRLMDMGEPIVRCALYLPVREWWADGGATEEKSTAFFELGAILEKNGADFDIVDEEVILSSGLFGYQAVYIGEWGVAKPATQKRLEQYIADGGMLYTIVNTGIEGAKRIDLEEIAETVPRACEAITHNENIRCSARRMNNEEQLYFIYNEGFQPEKFTVAHDHLYEIDLHSKQFYGRVKGDEVWLQSGEGRFYYETALRLPKAVVSVFERKGLLTFCGAETQSRFRADGSIIRTEEYRHRLEDGQWPGGGFSGRVLYHYAYDFPDGVPEEACLVIQDVNNCCTVTINGCVIGTYIFFPCRIPLSGAVLKKHNDIEILVGNTVSSEIAKLGDKEYEYGPYHKMAITFEREVAGGGITGDIAIQYKSPEGKI